MTQRFFVGNLEVSSPAFGLSQRIPDQHTCNGENVSPELNWSGAPEGTKSFAIVVHDPDAPLVDGWTHWVAYNISGDATGLAEGETPQAEGINTNGNQRYEGPAPPPGHGTHHYYFWLYALDADLNLEPGVLRADLLSTIERHVLEQARLIGTYDR